MIISNFLVVILSVVFMALNIFELALSLLYIRGVDCNLSPQLKAFVFQPNFKPYLVRKKSGCKAIFDYTLAIKIMCSVLVVTHR